MRLWQTACVTACVGALLAGCAKSSDEASTAQASTESAMKAAAGADAMNGSPLHDAARQVGGQRSVVRQGYLVVEVANLDKAETAMKETIGKSGGYIAHEDGSDLASEQPVLHLVIKVPEPAFEGSISAFEALGRRTSKSIEASDITEQILDTQARLQQLQRDRDILVKQGQGTAMNSGFQSMKDRIKELQQQRDQLTMQASMSTIDLTLQQKANIDLAANANASWGGDAWNAAVSSAYGAFRVIGAGAIWLFVYSPIWLAIGALGWWGIRTARRDKRVSAA